mmetsp:Transcript_11178/g.32106  ORF Transcript_11178/g.32106 Transcript_11178/m.32106 type:complete len:158 (-) Transcript_11178:1556-2029(-)|eukprot:CAMPEP_0118970720 /NCGR_PEP_ID=MMETSP1173-20130426/7547_1 /TAXON_ID=1034831 /ORGANISM="Rhizochromulina marina cf, Strain CCMP1243" /LENGTH=157 /DNA_ID=CAMNT_0006920107 /DNA_START=28 /DNA_END=501 /DNA_ORIENTATION=+
MAVLFLVSLLLVAGSEAFTAVPSGATLRLAPERGLPRRDLFGLGKTQVEEEVPPPGRRGRRGGRNDAKPQPQKQEKKRDWRFRPMEREQVQNLGRSDFMDVSDQMDAGFLPDWAKSFATDKAVGGPQRTLESVIAVQLVFAFAVLLPAVGGVLYLNQ